MGTPREPSRQKRLKNLRFSLRTARRNLEGNKDTIRLCFNNITIGTQSQKTLVEKAKDISLKNLKDPNTEENLKRMVEYSKPNSNLHDKETIDFEYGIKTMEAFHKILLRDQQNPKIRLC